MAVLLNKADLPAAEARSDEELKLSLGLQEVAELRGKQDGALEAFRVSLVRNEGYTEALRWLADYLWQAEPRERSTSIQSKKRTIRYTARRPERSRSPQRGARGKKVSRGARRNRSRS